MPGTPAGNNTLRRLDPQFVFVFIAAALFLFMGWRHPLASAGGFILVIGAVVGGWYLASLLSRTK